MRTDAGLAHFGGWKHRATAGVPLAWGDPYERNVEVTTTVALDEIVLPDPHDIAAQDGLPYVIVNAGPETLTVHDNATLGGTPIATLAVDKAAIVHRYSGADPNEWSVRTTIASVQRGQPVAMQSMVIDIDRNSANVNLLALAVAQGYDGSDPVHVTCRVAAGIVIGSTSANLRSWTTGTTVAGVSWAAGSSVLLELAADATIGGYGGKGGRSGIPGTGQLAGLPGGNGGQAMRFEIPGSIIVGQRSVVFGGGGGGGGGESGIAVADSGGGGGGGRGCNMDAQGNLVAVAGGIASGLAQPGTGGGPFARGAGGLGVGAGGDGGDGGGATANGADGTVFPNGGTGGTGSTIAVSYLAAAGAPTIIQGAAQIIGTITAEAS